MLEIMKLLELKRIRRWRHPSPVIPQENLVNPTTTKLTAKWFPHLTPRPWGHPSFAWTVNGETSHNWRTSPWRSVTASCNRRTTQHSSHSHFLHNFTASCLLLFASIIHNKISQDSKTTHGISWPKRLHPFLLRPLPQHPPTDAPKPIRWLNWQQGRVRNADPLSQLLSDVPAVTGRRVAEKKREVDWV